MQQDTLNTFSFNNFKPYGEKMQTFSKKPITLIYGPNSVGKSSLLKALLYKQHMKDKNFSEELYTNKKDLQLNTETDKFGDLFNIGTYYSVIHQNDTSKSINFLEEYNSHEHIYQYLIPNIYLSNMLLGVYSVLQETSSDDTIFEQFNLLTKSEIFFTNVFSPDVLKHMFDDLNIAKSICINLFNMSKTITSIKIETSIEMTGVTYTFYVNNQILFIAKDLKKSNSISISYFTENDFVYYLKQLYKNETLIKLDNQYDININKQSDLIQVNSFNIEENTFLDFLNSTIKFITYMITSDDKYKSMNNVHYIGPLRKIPKRDDLYGRYGVLEKQKKNEKKIRENYINCRYISSQFSSQLLRTFTLPFNFMKVLTCKIKYTIENIFNSYFILNKKIVKLSTNYNSFYHLWHSVAEDNTILHKINNWLKNKGKHNSFYSLKITNYSKDKYRIDFYDHSTNTNVHPQDMGVGISQSLPIIIASHLYHKTDIYIEQPELHLHPKLQMELADEFIRSYKENNNEFMIETHSEHLLLRIMKRMRHTAENQEGRDKDLDLTPDDVCLLYVDSDDKSTYIKELRLSKKGKLLDHWPNGFFEEGYKERFQ